MKQVWALIILSILVAPGAIPLPSMEKIGYPSKKVQKINELLIFDFFLNFELAIRNDNISFVPDYVNCKSRQKNKLLEIDINGVLESEKLKLYYNHIANISKMEYNAEGYSYHYDFIYSNDRLEKIEYKDKTKFQFNYDKKGRLSNIAGRGLDSFVLNILYGKEKGKVALRFDTIENGKMRSLAEKGHVAWNDKYWITSLAVFRYASKNMEYGPKGELKQIQFVYNFDVETEVNFDYQFDDNGFWIERSLGDKFSMYRKVKEIE